MSEGTITRNGINYFKINDYYSVGTKGSKEFANGHENGTNAQGPLIIPYEVDGIPIKEIAEYSFRNCVKLTSVTVYADLNIIHHAAFYYLSSVSSITFLGIVHKISQYAFSMYRDSNLNLPLRDSNHKYIIIFYQNSPIESVGRQAFEYVSNLTMYLHWKHMPKFDNNIFLQAATETIKIYGPTHGLTFANLTVEYSPNCRERYLKTCQLSLKKSYLMYFFISFYLI